MKVTRELRSKVIIFFFLMMFLIITACGGSSDDGSGGSSTYSISGIVSGDAPANVIITVSGADSANTATASDGTYTVSGLADGSYIVTPSSTGYSFNPSSTVIIVNGKNKTDVNFAESTKLSFTVSGVVTGTAFANVHVDLTGTTSSGTTFTSSNGIYNLAAVNGDDIVISPSLTGYRFMPANITRGNVTANVTGADFVSGVGNFTIDDLDGTWNFNMLWTDGQNDENTGWQSGTAAIANGILTFSNCFGVHNGEANATSCPTGVVAFTIDSASGVVTQTSGGSLIGQMASDRVLFAATATNDNGNSGNNGAQMFIAQKVTSGTTFSTSDIESTNWVIHKLRTGADNLWHYGTGTIDSNGIVTETSCTESDGSCTGGAVGTISVAGNGIITLSGSDFHGSLSSDKKTIVATETHNGNDYDLMIIQMTGQSYTAGNLPDGIYPAQVLSVYDHLYSQYTLPFWAYWTGYVMGGGVMNASDVEENNTGNGGSDAFVPYLPKTYTLDATGKVSETGTASYNGQMSNDGTFIVGTRSDSDSQGQEFYSLTFYLK